MCPTTLATLRCTNTSPGARPTTWFAGTRLSEQPIQRYSGACRSSEVGEEPRDSRRPSPPPRPGCARRDLRDRSWRRGYRRGGPSLPLHILTDPAAKERRGGCRRTVRRSGRRRRAARSRCAAAAVLSLCATWRVLARRCRGPSEQGDSLISPTCCRGSGSRSRRERAALPAAALRRLDVDDRPANRRTSPRGLAPLRRSPS